MAALEALNLRIENGVRERNVGLPRDVVTGTGDDPRPRIRVDSAQTSFFEGREFRSFYEFSVPTGQTIAMRFTSPLDFILHEQHFEVEQGHLRFSAAVDGTPGGVFTDRPVIGKNRMSTRPVPLYTPQCTFAVGGTHTGGTEVEVVRLKTNNNTNQATTASSGVQGERGLPAGTYYLRLQNLGADTLIGVYALWWEETAPRSSMIY